MKSKGFTLIELLAVIVILAIIALIAVPIILNIIGDAKEQSDLRSAELYLDAVEKAVARYSLTGEFPDAVCDVVAGGNLSCPGISNPIVVELNNSTSIKAGGSITFTNGKITAVEDLKINNSKYRLSNNQLVLVEQAAETDASCFIYQAATVTLTRELDYENIDDDMDVDKCKDVTLSYAVNVMGAPSDMFNDAALEAICRNDETTGYPISTFIDSTSASYSPVFVYMLYEAGAFKDPTSISVTPLDEVTILAYACNDSSVVIPSTLGGVTVTAIGDSAFQDKGLTSVIIPDTVTEIGESAFEENHLQSVTLSNSLETIGSSVFKNNKELTSVRIPNSVTTIERSAFKDCGLTSLTIPNSVETIGENAFSGNALASLTLGNGITTIRSAAFLDNNLIGIVIPDSVTTLENVAFSRNELTSVTIGSGITNLTNAFSSNKLTSVTIPDNVETMTADAFKYNNLSEVIIGSGIRSIGVKAFGCDASEIDGVTYGPNQLESVSIDLNEGDISFVSADGSDFCWKTGYENNFHWRQ